MKKDEERKLKIMPLIDKRKAIIALKKWERENFGNELTEDTYPMPSDIVSEILTEEQQPKRVTCPGGWAWKHTRYYCPNCKRRARQIDRYCNKCGQRLEFPVFVLENGEYVMRWGKAAEGLKNPETGFKLR